MSSIVLSGDTSGSVTVNVPSVAGTNTVTIPAVTGTVMVSSNMPAFSAYASAATSCSNATFTKILFDTKEFDTASNFSSSRFTPTVAGYYQINSTVNLVSPASSMLIAIFKNGAEYKRGAFANTTGLNNVNISSLLYCNGSTDYVEIYVYQNSGSSVNTGTGQSNTYFNGSMVRAA